MSVLQEFSLDNNKLIIVQDDCVSNPRVDFDNLGTFLDTQGNGDNTNFSFGRNYDSREDFIETGEEEVRKHFKDVAVILAVHKYQHSDVGYSTDYSYPYNCRWDSGTVGFIFATKKDIRENFGIKRVTKKYIEQTEKILKAEIETFSQWANGEVLGFRLENEDEEIIDSCYGFYGTDVETNGVLDHLREEWREVVKEAA